VSEGHAFKNMNLNLTGGKLTPDESCGEDTAHGGGNFPKGKTPPTRRSRDPARNGQGHEPDGRGFLTEGKKHTPEA